MALITDPDFLSQGAVTAATGVTFGTPTGSVVTISGTGLPGLAAGDYFEIRGANQPENNGLYVETGGAPTTSSITATKVAGDNGATPVVDAVSSATTFLHDDDTVTEEKSVYFDVYNREIWLLKQGSLTADGATLQAIYSFAKEEWKNDDDLIFHPFPFVAITPEQFELQDGWVFHTGTDAASIGVGDTVQDTETRKLVRTGGWREIAADNTLNQEWVCVITLGNFEDNTNDLAYFQQGDDPTDTAAAQDFTFNGPVNEAIRSYYYMPSALGTVSISSNVITRTTGDWTTDGYRVGGQITITASDTAGDLGTWEITALTSTTLTVTGVSLADDADNTTFRSAVNNRNVLNVFLRSDYLFQDGDTTGKTYAQQALSDIGVSEVDNKVFRFPLSNVLDLSITETDANIGANAALDSGTGNYGEIVVKYFDGAFTRDVDDPSGSNPRSFGIVIEVGVHTGIEATFSGSVMTTLDGGVNDRGATYFDGGKLFVHEGTNKGTYNIVSHTDTTVTVSETFTTDATGDVSFTVQREDDVDVRTKATTAEIYEAIQYRLRQDANINTHNSAAVVGATADALLRFVGTELEAGQALPTNPNGGGSGVIIEGLLDHAGSSSNDFTFFDNGGTARTFPFVASGTISFNNNLYNDADAKFWMFFTYTKRTTGSYSVTSASGQTATITGSANLPVVVDNQYIRINGFANEANNGLYRVNDASPTTSAIVVYKADGTTLVDEGPTASVTIDEDPIDSPEAIIVNDNDGNPITGTIPAAVNGVSTRSFTFDYDNNAQGERTAGQGDAAVTIRAIGFGTAAFVETSGTIGQTGNAFSLVAALERNYSNAA
jgi:hypothetical protein